MRAPCPAVRLISTGRQLDVARDAGSIPPGPAVPVRFIRLYERAMQDSVDWTVRHAPLHQSRKAPAIRVGISPHPSSPASR